MKKILITVFFLFAAFSLYGQDYNWYKGNTHTHTTNSDGNELPKRVIRWYQDHDYNFLVLSDHNTITKIKYLDSDKNDDFILIQGEEVTDAFEKKPVHLNGLNLNAKVEPQHGKSVVEALQNNIDAIRKAGGIPQINHPNWRWAFTDKEMSQLKDIKLIEVYNANVDCNNFGAGGAASMEEIWDKLLSKGMEIYGIASDDTHDYLGEFSKEKANPGKGWVMVKAKELTTESILNALEKGEFYASSGVILTDLKITDKEYSLSIKPMYGNKYTTLFIGKDGKVLKEDYNQNATYTFKGDELYVRAKVITSGGEFAYTQPVFIKK
jgi:hypothetical protein